MNNVKILIVGAGHVGKDQISEAILKHGLDENSVTILDANEFGESESELKKTITEKEVLDCLELRVKRDIEKMLEPQLPSSCSNFRNYEKQSSQQGWKNRQKHKR